MEDDNVTRGGSVSEYDGFPYIGWILGLIVAVVGMIAITLVISTPPWLSLGIGILLGMLCTSGGVYLQVRWRRARNVHK